MPPGSKDDARFRHFKECVGVIPVPGQHKHGFHQDGLTRQKRHRQARCRCPRPRVFLRVWINQRHEHAGVPHHGHWPQPVVYFGLVARSPRPRPRRFHGFFKMGSIPLSARRSGEGAPLALTEQQMGIVHTSNLRSTRGAGLLTITW